MLIPLYDNEDSVCGICLNGEYFYFQKNLQGDIISVTDKDANEVAKYTYDAWGVCTIVSDTSACSIATINPYRYRGYYFDTEIGMYYLQTRYYEADTGRFITADDPGMIIILDGIAASNIYSYSYNVPTVFFDFFGCATIAIPMFVGAYGATLSGAALIAKLTSFAVALFPYLIWGIVAIVVAAVAAYIAYVAVLAAKKAKTKTKTKTKIPSKLKNGNKVKTPDSHKNEFRKRRGGGYEHDKTKWLFDKSRDGHYGGDHWHAYPPNGQTGDYYNIAPNGNILS